MLINAGTALVIAAMCLGSAYFLGSANGSTKVQTKWDADSKARSKAIDAVRLELATQETQHKAESKRIEDGFNTIKEKHEKSLVALQLEYTSRLRTSETRGSVYKRQAEGGTLERDRLVEFTTELDRTLEEGRGLVRELGQTLGQCEQQRQLFSEQITNDRRLY